MLTTLLQEGAENLPSLAAEEEPVEKTLSLFDLLMSGGISGQIIIIVLFVLLFVAIYIYFERLFAIKAASGIDSNFMNQIKDHVANGNIEAAKILCAQQNSPVSRLTAKGISRIGSPLEDINTAIENSGRLEVYRLEKNVSVLATIAGAGPMIGFLGTVIGMVLAFHQLATSSGQAEMGNLAEGIYTAMTTTVAGLIVGIVAYIGYNHLVVRTDKVVHQMEATAVDFLDLLNEPA
ncbi:MULTISPECIES: MotA/TolQ/ExbB proton channel family protein [Leeuwenhoekiella]|uniref:MotA/TolQ/ExbB proton channel family protein n=1 Tax=Leeuwenhoekiella parthenopeia TaxID=2890320 RepID=A0ABS8GWD0_9FLAO|nr:MULTISPECIES: MotA/TolQ/ExbB proton channel family protein [Leeuwenhoekiella]MAW96441.1 biopolymer transporter ExbB [Leeuwenhoekiella sp.]MBA81328.1 biopolymer transporter ExbB [Leeuwenhoekiella sp.]MCC4213502.1 MotA/TolQ/ExbB proton channel family protein [Leeuwenhoekiella parthenopeia]|tara:strand:+ start:9178 stop:9882 length:705 start_codon:yes stop_codon:yes gene_type:complete